MYAKFFKMPCDSLGCFFYGFVFFRKAKNAARVLRSISKHILVKYKFRIPSLVTCKFVGKS